FEYVARTRAPRPGAVVLVEELAALQREAAAADALVELGLGPGQERDLFIELLAHRAADPLPVRHRGRAPAREGREFRLDLPQSQPELLGDEDEAQPADVGPHEPALVAHRPVGLDQAA